MEKIASMTMMELLVFMFIVFMGMSEGVVYKVGDDVGWTFIGTINYTSWAMSKKFHMGDTIVFEYNKNLHSVLEVSNANYDSCNTASPIVIHNSGNDSIVIKSMGHNYFICGIPTHCDFGMKLDIEASESSFATPSPLTTTTPPIVNRGNSISPSTPNLSSGTKAIKKGITFAIVFLSCIIECIF